MATDEKSTLDVARFVKPPDDDLICAICLGVAREAVETECGHLFCEECMNMWMAKSKTCPVDRQKIDRAQVRPTRYVRNKILNLKMKCTCGTTHSVRELNSHEQECVNHRRKCDTCDVFVKKSLYEAHLVDQFGLHYDALVTETKQLRCELEGLREVVKQQRSVVKQNDLLKEQMGQLKTYFDRELKLLKSARQFESEEKTAVKKPKFRKISAFQDSSLLDQTSAAKLIEFLGGNCQSSLLLKASRDGFATKDFHNHCDRKGPTVVVIKRTGSESIYGGYTPLDWTSPDRPKWCGDDQLRSFLFTMSDENGRQSKYKLKRSKADKAILCRKNCGPTFGSGLDLKIGNNSNTETCNYTWPSSYEVPSRTALCGQYDNYTITEIEVFSIYN